MAVESAWQALGQRAFSPGDQAAFARFSGDANPLHMDPVHARRSLAGQTVVHGIHSLLWSLDCWTANPGARGNIASLKAQFIRPVPVGETLACRVRECDPSGKVHIEACVPAGSAMLAEISLGTEGCAAALRLETVSSVLGPPALLGIDDLTGREGSWGLQSESGAAARMFPRLAALCGESFVVMLANTSRLVGMECPGLYSLYSELELAHDASSPGVGEERFKYSVTRVDRRFGLITMRVEGAGLAGSVKAFLRPPPARQAKMPELAGTVPAKAFSAQRALVVGGSRGLGELAAKVLAAGGADVCISYLQGRDDAEAIVAQIRAHGGTAAAVQLDVRDSFDPARALPAAWRPTHLYYFATPFIFAGERSGYSPELMARFCACYVDGFARMVEPLRAEGLEGAFYPSSVALDELPTDMAEYCAAKAAGEVLCRLLARRHAGLRIVHPRLPRLATDQTASLLPLRTADPLPLLLDLFTDFALSPSR